jgi:hypothetical protein
MGLISTATDKDVYRLEIDGALNVTLAPTAPLNPNLDAQLRVLDSTGAVIASSNPVDRGSPTLNLNLAGCFFLEVDGVGQGSLAVEGSYSDYASLGQYELSGTAVPGDPDAGCPPSAVGAVSAGPGPLVMSFSSAGSSDPEGHGLTYLWTFGDTTTSTDANPTHTYAKPGKYTAQLAVTDVGDQTSTVVVNVVVPDPAKQLTITTITGVRKSKGTVKVTVTVVDGYGKPVKNALVRGKWLGRTTTSSAYTSSKGVATLYRYTTKDTQFTTTKVSRSGRTWDGVNVNTFVAAF